MLHVTRDIERTFLRKLRVTLDIETSFLTSVGGIHQRISRSVQRFNFDTLAVLDMNGRTGIGSRYVGQVEVIQLDGGLVRSFVIETTVRSRAGEGIGDLLCHVFALDDAYVRTAIGNGEVFRNISCYRDSCGGTAVNYFDRTIGNGRLIDVHLIYLAERKDFAHDG